MMSDRGSNDINAMSLDFSSLARIVASFGQGSPTSLQRVFFLSMSGGDDLSREPLPGHNTDALFLSTRNEKQLAGENKKKRRRGLRSLSSAGLLSLELMAELQQLETTEDAESDLSDIEVGSIYQIDAAGRQTQIGSGVYRTNDDGKNCKPDCPLRIWEISNMPSTFNIEEATQPKRRQRDISSLYSPLLPRQIRALEILPGQGNMPVKCQLRTLGIDATATQELQYQSEESQDGETPQYEALSYCWGSPDLTHTIICNHILVNVTHNIHAALYHLRKPTLPRLIWVDAICINQSDVSERSAQVRYMLEIYQKASRVVIWLGDITKLDAEIAITSIKALENPEFRNQMVERKHDMVCLDNLARAMTSLGRFYRQSWFSRTWIRQELAAGRKVIVQCGAQELSWNMIKRAAKRMERMEDKVQAMYPSDFVTGFEIPRNLNILKRSWVYGQSVMKYSSIQGSWYYWHGGGLLELLLVGGDFDATDPRDRVFGVLGLAREPIEGGNNESALWPYTSTDSGDRPFEPFVMDYAQDVSQVFQRLAKHVINRDRNLDVLCVLAVLPRPPKSDLPSWTPDWRIPRDTSLLDSITQRYEASGFTRAEYQSQEKEGQLDVKAYHVDDIEQLLDVTTNTWNLLYENGEAIIKSNGALENRTEWLGHPVMYPFDHTQHARRCCMTRNGRVAVVPREAQVADGIYILLGARMPFVLRPAALRAELYGLQDSSKILTVVGPGCLPGHMHGQVFTAKGDAEPLDFKLV